MTDEAGAPPLVQVTDATVDYASGPFWRRRHLRALDGVSLSVARGETVGIVGESGSGKTTLARLCLGLVRPTLGSVTFEGTTVGQSIRKHPGRIQVVLQHPEWSLNPRLRVAASVAEPLIISGGQSKAQRREKVQHVLELVGIDSRLSDRYPHELSGGQRQRVAIARALVTSPAFIVFDEVVSALDVSVQSQILNLIARLQVESGFGALFVSHEISVVRYLSHRVAVMRAGRVVETATAAAFYTKPSHAYSRELLEAAT